MSKEEEFYLKMLELVKKHNPRNKKSKSPKENYILNVFKLFLLVDNSINNLNLFEHYLTIEPFPKHFIEKNINERDYYKFQFENFYIRCSSILDFKMHLINTALQIGLPKHKCGYHSLNENLNIKETSLSTKITKLYGDFKEHIMIRNKIVHQGYFDSELLDGITAFLSIPNLPEELYDEEYENYSKAEKSKNIKDAIKELNSIQKKIEFHFGEILEELIPIIELQISIFELKERK